MIYNITSAVVLLCTPFVLSAEPTSTPAAPITEPASRQAGREDTAWYDQKEIARQFPARYTGEIRHSRYLTMRDGCRIAVEVFLPQGLREGDRIPTVLHQTRYWRSTVYRWPLSNYREPERLVNTRHFFVPRGYAWVAVDVRGSGASFGYRPCEYSIDEIRDGADIVDWIIRQPWSDGQVCSTGISYDGGTAELLATNKHPAVKAIAPLFSMFDPYLEVGFPGGIHLSWFTQIWGSLGMALDRNELPEFLIRQFGPMVKTLVEGVRPVEEDADKSILAAAIRSHQYNWNLHETTLRVVFRDDPVPYDWKLSFDAMSPCRYSKDLDACGVVVYSYSGWFDAAFQHSAIKRHQTLKGPNNRLIIGPWDHGGRYDCTPPRPRTSQFDMNAELFRFFEYHLRRADTGIQKDKPIHYFTMGQGRWKAADAWPPTAEPRRYYFSADHQLATDKPTAEASDRYTMDYTHATGGKSRWNCLVMGGPVVYPNRTEQNKKLLSYTTAPLSEDTEITGHPLVTLHVTSPHRDGNFLVYLEDVDPNGVVNYVSEGELRAIHRRISSDAPPCVLNVPHHTYRRADRMELVPQEPAELVFDILPTSYEFKAGHRIRIAIAGADTDHFATPPGPPPAITIHRSAIRPSGVILPVVSDKKGT